MKKYEITFMLTTGNSGMQKAVITASDATTARKIWEQSNPGCRFSSIKEIR